MSLIVNWRGSDALVAGSAKAPTDTGLESGRPEALDASGRELLELRELAVNYSTEDPCIWLRKKDNSLAKFRPTAGVRVVDRAADLPVPGTAAAAALKNGDTYLVRYAPDGSTPENRLVVWDAPVSGAPGGWNWKVEPRSYVKQLISGADVASVGPTGRKLQEGDLQLTVDGSHEELKVFTGGLWHNIFSWDRLRQEVASNHWAGRFSDLPVPAPGQPIANGSTYMVRMDLGGAPLDRMFVWRELTPDPGTGAAAGGEGLVRADSEPASAAYKRLSDLPDIAIATVSGLAQLAALAGHWWTWDGPDHTFTNSDIHGGAVPLAGRTIHAGDKLWFVDRQTSPGRPPIYAWSLGAPTSGPGSGAASSGTGAQTGEWHIVDQTVWVKARDSDADNATDAKGGDLTVTLEKDKESIKVFDPTTSAWVVIPATDSATVKRWISSLSLFQGTAVEVGHTVPGAVDFNALPDLSTASTPALKDIAAHYWIFVGTSGYTVKAGDPHGLGRDIVGAKLNPGDWLMVSNRSTDPTKVDAHWVVVSGDLLSATRARALYSHETWRPGSYETGTVIVFNKSLWRSIAPVAITDGAPREGVNVAQVETLTVAAAAGLASGTAFTVTVGGVSVTHTTAAAGESAAVIAADLVAQLSADPTISQLVKAETTPVAGEIKLTATVAGVPFTATVVAGTITPAVVTANATVSPWVKIDLASGVRWVATDADRDAVLNSPRSDIYFVLSSAEAGGKGALYYYDSGAKKWQPLGGGGGVPMTLSGGHQLLSVGVPVGAMMMWPAVTVPRGWLLLDGSTIDPLVYPELSKVLVAMGQGNTLPDFRGAYVRGAGRNPTSGWGNAANTPLGVQEDSTARPKTPFTADSQGAHTHTVDAIGNHSHGLDNGAGLVTASRGGHDLDPGGGGNPEGLTWTHHDGAHTHTMQSAGAHTHTITGGGDSETRPKSIFVSYIIKADDSAIVMAP